MLIEQPTREIIQALLSSQFDSTVVYPAPMVFKGISIWRTVGIRSGQDVVVDLLLVDSDYLKTALSRRRTVIFGELNVPVLAIEDLIVLKTLAGCLQDQADLEKIRARQDAIHVDWSYVDGWKIKLDLRG